MSTKLILMIGTIALTISMTGGCMTEPGEVAREAANRQAQQNTEMARLNREVASGSHQLVEADAKAREELVGVQRDLQAERTRLDSGWTDLNQERRDLVAERRTESMLVSIGKAVGYLLLVVVLLGLCWRMLVVAGDGNASDAELNELLIDEIVTCEVKALPEAIPTLPKEVSD
jgi:hypothetical protein